MPFSGSMTAPVQPGLVTLTSPKWRSSWARLRRRPVDAIPGRGVLLGAVGTLFLGVAFTIAWRVVRYFAGVPESRQI